MCSPLIHKTTEYFHELSNGGIATEYGWQPHNTWGTDPLYLRTTKSGETGASPDIYYYQNDHLGTPQKMIDVEGNPVWEAKALAFGETEVGQSSVITNPLRFPGQYYDEETKTHYNYFRDYNPAQGRYVQRDPIGLGGGINVYGYAQQNPVVNIDMLGLDVYRNGSGGNSFSDRQPYGPCQKAIMMGEYIVGWGPCNGPTPMDCFVGGVGDGGLGSSSSANSGGGEPPPPPRDCTQPFLCCLANCIEANDPLNPASKAGLTAIGGTFPKKWLGVSHGLRGAPSMTTIPSAIGHALGGGAGTLGGAARGLDNIAYPVRIGYGVYLFGMEGYCVASCANNKCAY